MKLYQALISVSLAVQAAATVTLRGSDSEPTNKSARFAASAAHAASISASYHRNRFLKKKDPAAASLEAPMYSDSIEIDNSPHVVSPAEVTNFNEMAKHAEGGFEMISFDDEQCLQDADACEPSAIGAGALAEDFIFTAVSEVSPLLKLYSEAEGLILTEEDIAYAVTLQPTEELESVFSEEFSKSMYLNGGHRRLASSCPAVTADKCMPQLREAVQNALGSAYNGMNIPSYNGLAKKVVDEFKTAHFCAMEGWFAPFIQDDGIKILQSAYWNTVGLIKLPVLAAVIGWQATGFRRFMSLLASVHSWWQMAYGGAVWTATVVGTISSFGIFLAAKIALTGWRYTIPSVLAYATCVYNYHD